MIGLTEKQSKRLDKVVRLNEQNADKYCWADLHDMAICEDREERLEHKESAKGMRLCKQDIEENGSCWCGKFKK